MFSFFTKRLHLEFLTKLELLEASINWKLDLMRNRMAWDHRTAINTLTLLNKAVLDLRALEQRVTLQETTNKALRANLERLWHSAKAVNVVAPPLPSSSQPGDLWVVKRRDTQGREVTLYRRSPPPNFDPAIASIRQYRPVN